MRSMDVRAHLEPSRERPDIEWSVTMSPEAISTDRFVIYGLDEAETLAFLEARGVDWGPLVTDLTDRFGRPAQVAVGKDGDRTKLYWFLSTERPAFIGLDVRNGRVSSEKSYHAYAPEASEEALGAVAPELAPTLRWLFSQDAFQGSGLFHSVLFRRGAGGPFTGAHVGFSPDWAALLRGDQALLRRGLVHRFLERLGMGHHAQACHQHLLEAPTAWTCYLSAQIRPTGEFGATIYARSSPVVPLTSGMGLVEPGPGGTFPRPVVVSFGHAGLRGVRVRLCAIGSGPVFFEHGGWRVTYSDGGNRPLAPEQQRLLRDLARQATDSAPPSTPVGVFEWLQQQPHVQAVTLGPDMRLSEPTRSPSRSP